MNLFLLLKKIQFYITKKNKKTKKKLKVGFLVYFPNSWSALRSIYDASLSDHDVDPYIICIPINTSHDSKFKFENRASDFFKSSGINFLDGMKKGFNIKSLKLDVLFVQTPYDGQRPSEYKNKILYRCGYLCYVQYAFIITSSSFEKDFFGSNFHKKCWKIFAESKYHKYMYQKYGIKEKNISVSGYPKFDCYKNSTQSLNRERKVKKIIWTPHWTIGKIMNASNFLHYKDYFLNLPSIFNNLKVVIRPHPMLFEELISQNHLNIKELDHYIEKINLCDNISLDFSCDYFDLFQNSDLLVSDNSSFLAEYLPTKKPIIYTHSYCHDSYNLNGMGQSLTQYHYIAKNEKDLHELIVKVLINCNDYNMEKRIKNTSELLRESIELDVGYKIVKQLKQELLK